MEHFVTILALIGIVIIVASLLSGALERHAVPVVAVFLALGVLLGPWGLRLLDIGFGSPELRVLATLALALVLFSDGVTLNIRELRPRRRLLLRLLGPGTLVPAVIVAFAAHFLLDVPAPGAAILGAALASTDPVLLRNALRSRAMPDTVRIALRMETGLNDILLLPVVIIAMLLWGGSGVSSHGVPHDLPRSVLGLFLLGPVLGVVVGWIGISALSWVRRRAGVRRDYESLYGCPRPRAAARGHDRRLLRLTRRRHECPCGAPAPARRMVQGARPGRWMAGVARGRAADRAIRGSPAL